MSIAFDTFARLGAGADVQNLSVEPYRGDRVPPSIFPDAAQYPEWSASEAITEGYQQCSVLAQVVTDLAEMCASRPWYWVEVGAGRHGSDQFLEPVEFLEYPDPKDKVIPGSGIRDRHRNHSESVVDLLLAGHAYTGVMWKGLTAKQEPRKLKVEDPHGVAPFLDKEGRLVAFEWDSSTRGGYRYWDIEDILQVIWQPNPQNRNLGFTLLWPLAPEVDAYVELTRMQLTRIRRGAAPGAIVTDPAIGKRLAEGVDPEAERRDVENSLNRNAARTFGGYVVLGGEQTITQAPTFNARQLQLLETLTHLRDRIWSCFGPHPTLISPDASTDNNMEHAAKQKWARAVLINERFANCYTHRFVPPEKRGKLIIAPDYRDVQELQDLDMKVEHTAKLVRECQFSVNSAIATTGLRADDQPGGDLVLVNPNMIPKEQAGEGLGDESP